MSETHTWRSPLLGEANRIELPQGELEFFQRGPADGPTLVFVHGWLANANLWRNVVDRLSGDFRCLVLDLPLGAHRVPMPAGADLGPDGIAAVIESFLSALGLSGVTLVGNDSGGAYSQIAVARHTDRVARLVLTSCETPSDVWPPAQFEYLRLLARDPEALRMAAEGLRDPSFQEASFGPAGGIMKRLPPPEVLASYALAGAEDPEVRKDVAVVISTASTAALRAASRVLVDGPGLPTLLVWSSEDAVFPVAHAQAYAEALPQAELVVIDDALTFTPEDRPDAVADAIKRFAA